MKNPVGCETNRRVPAEPGRQVPRSGPHGPGLLLVAVACAAVLLTQLPAVALADNVQTTKDTLLDRIQIEDLISNYYWDMTSEGRHNLADYYVDDAVLDVNGIIYRGHKEIQAAYAEGGSGDNGRIHMLLNNPRIRVNGNTATAETVWTGVISETVRLAPRLYEQGREYTELVKKDGRWMFSKRMITSDAGLTERYDGIYQKR